MKLTKNSIEIEINSNDYPFRLECDDRKGIIRLTKNKSKDTTKITERNIPISEERKWAFHKARTGYAQRINGDEFTGSFISKQFDPQIYDFYMHYMYNKYKKFKKENSNEGINNK